MKVLQFLSLFLLLSFCYSPPEFEKPRDFSFKPPGESHLLVVAKSEKQNESIAPSITPFETPVQSVVQSEFEQSVLKETNISFYTKFTCETYEHPTELRILKRLDGNPQNFNDKKYNLRV